MPKGYHSLDGHDFRNRPEPDRSAVGGGAGFQDAQLTGGRTRSVHVMDGAVEQPQARSADQIGEENVTG